MAEHPRFNPSRLPRPSGYAHALHAGDIVFLSGQVALDADRRLIGPGDMETQARQVFSNLDILLGEVGMGWPDVAKLTIFLTDIDAIDAVRRVRQEIYEAAGMEPPATTSVEVSRLAVAGALLEVEAIAIRRSQKS